MRVWSGASRSNLCRDDVGMIPTVGEDTLSGCLVRVSRTQVVEMENSRVSKSSWCNDGTQIYTQVRECEAIHNSVAALQKKLLGGADVLVGRRGNVNFTNPSDFVRVIQQNKTDQRSKTEMGMLLPSCKVPSLIRMTVLHTAGRVARQGEQELLVVGVKATLAEETWTWRCTSLICPKNQTFLLRTEVEWVEVPEVWADKNTSRCNSPNPLFLLDRNAILYNYSVSEEVERVLFHPLSSRFLKEDHF